MRNPDRIDEFCNRLAKCWHKEPDWRFGQLICNTFGYLGKDPFFPEDDEMIRFLESYFKIDSTNDLKG